MSNVLPFPARHVVSDDLSIDLPYVGGTKVGAHLTEWGEIALFVEHEGSPVGGLLALDHARDLRDALSLMLGRACGPVGSGDAA